jgi:hypothetical protein
MNIESDDLGEIFYGLALGGSYNLTNDIKLGADFDIRLNESFTNFRGVISAVYVLAKGRPQKEKTPTSKRRIIRAKDGTRYIVTDKHIATPPINLKDHAGKENVRAIKMSDGTIYVVSDDDLLVKRKPQPKKTGVSISINPDKPLPPDVQKMLRTGLVVLRKNPRAKITIKVKAHKGNGVDNLEIDKKTAAAVMRFYVKSGIKTSRIVVEFID